MKRRGFEQSDLIRLRLERLDKLTSSDSTFEKLLKAAPVLPFAISLMAGIWSVEFISGTSAMWIIFWSSLLVCMLLLLLCAATGQAYKLPLTMAATCIIFYAAGLTRYYLVLHIPPNHISRCLQSDRQLATIKGVALSPVDTAQNNASIPWLEPHSSFYLKAQSILSDASWVPICGVVRIQVAEPLTGIRPGNQVLVYCWLSRFQPASNPGQFDIKQYMERKGVYVAASVPVRDGVQVIDASVSKLHLVRSFLYRFCEDSLLDDSLPDRDIRSLSAALLLGRRENLEPAIMAAFQKTNLAHYISLSGQNVGILAGSLWILLRTLGLAKRPRALLCILLIVLYALVVPPMPAINRAVFLSCFIFASLLMRRRSRPINTLAISALVLLLFRPSELFSMGWQLSYLSVAGILVLYEPVVFHLRNWFFYPFILTLENRFVFLQHCLHGLLNLTAVGIAAWLAIAGLLLFYFGSVNPLSPVWTVLVMPFMLVLLYAGYLKLAIAKLLPTTGSLLSLLIHYAARGFEESVMLLSKVDFCQIVSRPPPVSIIVLIYAAILIFFFVPLGYRKLRFSLGFTCLILFVEPFIFQSALAFRNRSLEVTCLSVGHGQTVVVSDSRAGILFDAGSITVRDSGGKIVVPFLQHKGISSLDAIYLSHGDLDHINGIADIAASVRVEKLYANMEFLRSAGQPSPEQQLCRSLETLGLVPGSTGEMVGCHGLTVRSLWPTQATSGMTGLSDNDKSEVFLIQYAGRRLLLCGDIELYAQQQLMQLYPELRTDVMVLPHHGSTVNLDERFIEHFNPEIVVASCAFNRCKNAWHPAAESKIRAFYTGADGAITIKIKADGTLSADGFLNPN